jgi:hypothetical protein
MDVGESINVAMIFREKWTCPFPHETDFPPADNDLTGVGTTLGNRMEAGSGTATRADSSHHTAGAVPYPAITPVNVDGADYDLTLAAHHLIPAQESLKDCDILDYIDKERGVIKENLGYDVNGTQNGIWLPGPYAVDGWGAMTLEQEDLPDTAKRASTRAKRAAALPGKLSGEKFQGNYSMGAMEQTKRQFHDRHVDYSNFVRQYLEKIHVNMLMVELQYCDKCKNRGNEKLPPPLSLVARLNGLSKKLSGYLIWPPSSWVAPLYTSGWSVLMRAADRPGN